MRYQSLYVWGLMAALSVMMSMTAQAKQLLKIGNSSSIRIVTNDDADDQRAFQQWFREQVRGYDEIDPDTGEPIHQLLHVVTDVNGARIEILDRDYDKHTVLVTKYTRITYKTAMRSKVQAQGRRARPLPPDPDRASRVRPGDLVIVQGYLRANGQFTASMVRIVDHIPGWDDDWDDDLTYDGYRAWGEVVSVNVVRGYAIVNTNDGRKTVALARGGVVWAKGREEALSYLRRGDRVVFYYRNPGYSTLQAYRIVWLDRTDRYPVGNRPHWADPDFDNDQDSDVYRSAIGRIVSVRTGSAFFTRLVIRVDNGRELTLRVGNKVKAMTRHGDAIDLDRLQKGDVVRIRYSDINGIYIARSVVVR